MSHPSSWYIYRMVSSKNCDANLVSFFLISFWTKTLFEFGANTLSKEDFYFFPFLPGHFLSTSSVLVCLLRAGFPRGCIEAPGWNRSITPSRRCAWIFWRASAAEGPPTPEGIRPPAAIYFFVDGGCGGGSYTRPRFVFVTQDQGFFCGTENSSRRGGVYPPGSRQEEEEGLGV